MEIEELAKIAIPILVVVFFSSLIPRKLNERQKIIKEADNFTSSFADEIRFIDSFHNIDRAGRDIPDVLSTAYDRHEKAFIQFYNCLGEWNKRKIKKAWQDYTGKDKLMGKPTFRQYANDGIKNRIKGNDKIALERINNILKFAKHK